MSTQAINRRSMLLGAAGLGAGVLVSRLGLPRVEAGSHGELVTGFAASLSPAQYAQVFLPWDHPSRQLVNTLAIRKSPHIGTLFNAQQMPYVWRLWESMQSDAGVARFREPLRAEAGGLDGCVLTIYGDPASGPCQSVISGGHLELRAGTQLSGAFGDGVAYGHQVGNQQLRIPGNVWAHHSDAINLLAGLWTDEQLTGAVVTDKPHELLLQVQGRGGRFDGLPVSTFNAEQRAAFCELLATMFAAYAPQYVEQATSDLQHLGGIDQLSIALYAQNGFYRDGARYPDVAPRGDERAYFQVWRIEGPGFVLHFEGYPHVHAYLRITKDPDRQHVGESLAQTSRLIDGEPVRRFVETAMRETMDADVGIMLDRLPGRFVPGTVTTGTLWSLDPYGNSVVTVTMKGSRLGSVVRQRLGEVDPGREYRITTLDYFLREHAETIGAVEQVETSGQLLRDILVAHARGGGLELLAG